MALLNELKARLGLDTASFSRGIKGVQNETRSLSQKMRAAILPAATAMTAMSAGLALAIKGQLDNADEMAKSAQKFGVPIEELSRLKYAADLSNVSLETLGSGLRGLSKNLSAAFSGNKGATKLFKSLGVEITDVTGRLRPTEAVMQDISDVIAGMPDGAEKTAIAMKLFGKSGAEMIPMLNSGKSALRAMAEEANKMGIVIDEKTGNAAQNFNDNITRIKTAVGGLVVQMAAALAPALERVSGWVVDLTQWFQNLSPRMKEIAGMAALFAAALGPLGLTILGVSSALGIVVGALGTMAAALMAHPVIAIIAVVAAGAALIYANWDGIAQWFSDKFSAVKANIQFYWDLIKVDAALAWSWIAGRWDAAVTYFGELWVKIKQAFIDGWAKVKEVTAQWAADFLLIGGQIVDGLKQGISDKWDAMVKWFEGLADGLTASARRFFGIRSPSRVFRAIGRFLTEGLGLGIKDNVPMVNDAMAGVNAAVTGGAADITTQASAFGTAWKDAFKSFVFGTSSAKDALAGLADRMKEAADNQLFEMLWQGLFGGTSGSGGLFSGIASALGFAKGGAFMNGQVTAFANGGVVGSPTLFGMSGRLGVMGEAGPEAILPLSRGAGGRLGVKAQGGGGTIELLVTSDPGVIVQIARNESGMAVRQGLKTVPSLMDNYTKRNR